MTILNECLVIAANLCVNQSADVSSFIKWNGSGARIEVEGIKIDSLISSDQIFYLDQSKLPSACSGSSCIKYHRHCTEKNDLITCVIYYANQPRQYAKRITVSYLSNNHIVNEIDKISLVVEGGHLIPLSKFSISGSSDIPPVCRSSDMSPDECFK